MSDLTKLSALELSSELTKGSVSAVEVTKAHLDRIDSLDKSVQSFLHVDKTGAIKQAEEVDKNRKENKKVSCSSWCSISTERCVNSTRCANYLWVKNIRRLDSAIRFNSC